MSKSQGIQNPDQLISQGFDVHLVFEEGQIDEARALFRAFMNFVNARGIPHDRALVFEKAVGPWPTPMWQLLLRPELSGANLQAELGQCLSWLMINRGPFSVMIHPNTDESSPFGGGLKDHRDHCLWMGPAQSLKLKIFED